jgi:hypothetical protein
MSRFPIPRGNTRVGFHYFPDTDHFRATNLNSWLPELQALGTSWLALQAPSDRAIPERFLKGLLEHNIEPVLLLDLPIEKPPSLSDLGILFSSYARWGVHYIRLFDRPNNHKSWSSTSWAQANLVERFLDRYLPFAFSALQSGLIPIFPSLEPGGDYWDTAFLRESLISIKRRGHQKLLDHLIIGAHANIGHRPITWGKGGLERWPQAKPYTPSMGTEDHRGFYIFEWYIPIIESVIQEQASIILFEAGAPLEFYDSVNKSILDLNDHTARNLSLIHALASNCDKNTSQSECRNSINKLEPIPTQVISCNLWLLTASPNSPHVRNAWYKPDGTTLPIVKATNKYISEKSIEQDINKLPPKSPSNRPDKLITHYLLLPSYHWGVTDWHLDLIKPFVKQHQPTIGFSLKEASKATRVSIVGGVQAFSQEELDFLKASGCLIDRISRDGTSIATIE